MADWKKRLLRVKQKADQKLGTAEKTEVLTDDLHSLEKWVEQVKTVGHNTYKRVQGCLHQTTSADKDKKLKKLPEYMLSTQLIEGSLALTQLRPDSLLGQLMKTCGEGQSDLASASMEYESSVEAGVLAPLHQLYEQDIPGIVKTRKKLSKLVLDMDSVNTRYMSTQKQQLAGNMPQNKVDAIREEFEDAESKVLACKDQLSTEMYKFLSSEPEYSNFLLHLVKAQADYHKKALQVLEKIIPTMENNCDVHEVVPVYGTSLEEHLRRTHREIATVIEDCIATLAEFGLEEEGLFRIAGGASKVKKLKAAFDAGLVDMEEFLLDVHCIAGALKLYLRELPEPLMTYELYDEWMAAAHMSHEDRMQQLWLLCDRLPKPNYDNLRYLIKFLAKLSETSEVHKMSPSNIAIVIGPNLLWPYGDAGPSVLTTTTQSSIVESLIQHADYFFPGDIHYGLGTASDKGTPPGTLNAAPQGMYPNLEDMTVISAPSLSPSGSSNSLQPDRLATQVDVSSPRTARKNKRAAPAPPGDKPQYRSHAPAPLTNLDKPPTSDKPHVSPAGHRPQMSPSERPPLPPDRPSVPPPAPPKPASPAAHYDAYTGTTSPARPPKPQVHEKPSNEKIDTCNQLQSRPASDNNASLPYSTRPDISYIDANIDAANTTKTDKNNSLTRNVNKPPRPPRPVTMCSKDGSDNTEHGHGETPPSDSKKQSVSEETHL